MSHFTKLIKTKGSAIKCEAAPGENGGHAGMILLVEADKDRIILGRTDPTYKSAKAAVDAMKDTVDAVRNGVREPVVEEPDPESKIPVPAAPEKKPKKKRRKRKSRKKKGESDGRTNSKEDDGRTEADGLGRKAQGDRMSRGEARE